MDSLASPPFFVYQSPVAVLHHIGDSSSSSSTGASVVVSRVTVDDAANDIIVFTLDGSVCFFHMRGPQSQQQDQDQSQPLASSSSSSLLFDLALSVRVKSKPNTPVPVLLVAKRCPQPEEEPHPPGGAAAVPQQQQQQQRKRYLVALSHHERSIFFYRCSANKVPLQHVMSTEGSALQASPVAALCYYQCAPNSIRYHGDSYPIRYFAWLDNTAKQQTTLLGCSKSSQKKKEMLCVSSVCVDLLAVEEAARREGGGQRTAGYTTRVLGRYPTRTDAWCTTRIRHGQQRVLMSVNSLKADTLKLFFARDERRGGIHAGARLKLSFALPTALMASRGDIDAIMTTTSSTVSPPTSHRRDPRPDATSMHLHVGVVEVYDQLFVYVMELKEKGACSLYQYDSIAHVSEGEKKSSNSKHAESDVDCIHLFATLSLLQFPSVREYHSRSSGSSATGGSSFSSPLSFPEVLVHVVDNLILFHAVGDGLTSAFDIFDSLAANRGGAHNHHHYDVTHASFVSQPSDEHTAITPAAKKTIIPSPTAWLSNLVAQNTLLAPGTFGAETPLYDACELDSTGSIPCLFPLVTASMHMVSPANSSSNSNTNNHHHIQRRQDTQQAYSQCKYALHGPTPFVCRQDGSTWSAHLLLVNPIIMLTSIASPIDQIQFLLRRSGCGGEAVPKLVRALIAKGSAADACDAVAAIALHGAQRVGHAPIKMPAADCRADEIFAGGDMSLIRHMCTRVATSSSEVRQLTAEEVMSTYLFSDGGRSEAGRIERLSLRHRFSQRDVCLMCKPAAASSSSSLMLPEQHKAKGAVPSTLRHFSVFLRYARALLLCGEPLQTATMLYLIDMIRQSSTTTASSCTSHAMLLAEGATDVLTTVLRSKGYGLVQAHGDVEHDDDCLLAESLLSLADDGGSNSPYAELFFTSAVQLFCQSGGHQQVLRAVEVCLARNRPDVALELCNSSSITNRRRYIFCTDARTYAAAMCRVLAHQQALMDAAVGQNGDETHHQLKNMDTKMREMRAFVRCYQQLTATMPDELCVTDTFRARYDEACLTLEQNASSGM